MKKKILLILITVLSLYTCIFTLTACGENEPPHTHEYTTLKYDAISHWYECTCGDKYATEDHKGGTATETNKATCSVCNQEYGESLGHIHTLHLTKVDATIQSCTQTGNIEYFTCSCGKWFTDNTATTEITDKESVVIAKDDHEYKELKKSATEHWYECICGAYEIKENHKNGTATCKLKATCSVCGTVYGNLAEHSPKQDWIKTETHHYHECVYGCTEKLNYGEHNFDNNKKCNDCDYVTTALLGTEISSEIYQINGTNLSLKVPNEQTNFSFANTINVAKGATYKVYTDISCKETYCIPSYAVNNLIVGNNTYYFLVSNGTEIPQVYTVKIRRRPMYTVTFNTDGGTSVSNQVIEEDSFVSEPLTTKTGYDFVSWNYDFNTPVTDNITITAEWNIKQYTLTVVYDNGQENLVLTQDYNTHIQTIKNPEKTGYSFAGWNNVIPTTIPAEDRIITANWNINQYTLKIVYDNGQEDLILTQDYNTPIQLISNPVREGYAFTGWDNVIPNTMPAENLTITATWEANENTPYKVEYYLQNIENDDYTLELTENKVGTTNTTANSEQKTFEHFTFNSDISIMTGIIMGDGSLVLKVYYTRNVYTLSVNNSSAGSITNSGQYKYGTPMLTSTVTINLGYNFVGWYCGDEKLSIDLTYNYTSGFNLIAKFEVKEQMTIFSFTSTPTICEITGLKDKTLTEILIPDCVTNIGSSAFRNCSSLTSIVISNSVTSIGESAFSYCSSLASIEMPNSVTSIGAWAFFNCSNLTNIEIPNSVTSIGKSAFEDCSSITSIEIPNSVTSIGSSAFKDCSSLASITLPFVGETKDGASNTYFGYIFGASRYIDNDDYVPTSLKSVIIIGGSSISEDAFYECSSLTSIEILDSVTSIGDWSFIRCTSLLSVTIGKNVKSIGKSAFYGCSSLISIEIPNSVTSIGTYAFTDSGLTKINYTGTIDQWASIEFGNNSANPICYAKNLYINDVLQTEITVNAEKINGSAFYNCDSLTSVVIGDSVTSIGDYAFYDCSSLTSVTIGQSVISIGNDAFDKCTRLTEINFNARRCEDVGIDDSIFSCAGENSSGIKVNIGINVTRIPANLFYPGYHSTATQNIVSLSFVDNSICESIGDRAFYNCDSLTSVTIANNVQSIGNAAFSSCSSLTSVTIGKSVTSIGSFAFYNCDALKSIYYNGDVNKWVEISFSSDFSNPTYYAKNLYIKDELVTEVNLTTAIKINDYAFCNCSSLTSVEIPDSVTSIGSAAFYGCSLLESVTIGDSVTSIGYYAFYGCKSLTSIEIPNSVTNIGYYAFYDCSSLTYNIKNGLKYLGNSDNPYLYLVGPENMDIATASIDNNCRVIGSFAFAYCTSLTSIEIPNSVTSIGSSAFYGCSSVTSVTIGNGVESIGSDAFYNFSSLKNVYYKGTESSWATITIGAGNSALSNATRYYYSETEPSLNADSTAYNGNYWKYDENGEIVVWEYKKES